jgi:uncharacterized protein YecE (DUF72 family)
MIRIGTSGYSYPEWRGSFYPEKFPTGKMLPYYAERFSTVEINNTFYRMPNAKTIAGWDAETPAHFSFTLKAPQRITHFARLRDIDDSLRYFLDTADALGPKLGTVLFQLPPNFKKDLARLDGLLTRLPAGLRCALEFRHESWLAEDVYERLRTANAALCRPIPRRRPRRCRPPRTGATSGCEIRATPRRISRSGPGPSRDSAPAGRTCSCTSSTRRPGPAPSSPAS